MNKQKSVCGWVLTSALLVGGCSDSEDPYKATAVEPKAEAPAVESESQTRSDPFATPAEPQVATTVSPAEKSPQDTPTKAPDSDPDTGLTEPVSEIADEPDVVGLQMEVTVDPGQVNFTPSIERSYERINITLASPTGKQIVKSFAPGEPVIVAANLADGSYTWEATTTVEVPPYIREEMRQARESGDFEAEKELISRLRSEGYLPTERQAQANRESGHFRIVNGSIPSADEVE